MPLLALNTVRPQHMRIKYQLAIGALPIGLMFASFAPLWGLATWLEANQGGPPNSPILERPNGFAWIAVFVLSMVFLMLAGYALGWVLNALISRHVLGWPSDKVRAVYLRSEIPVHWLKDGVSDTKSADAFWRNIFILHLAVPVGVLLAQTIFGPLPDSQASGGPIGLCVFGCFFLIKWSVELGEYLFLRCAGTRRAEPLDDRDPET